MKRLYLIPILLIVFCRTSCGQNPNESNAWEIIQKIKLEPLPGASQDAIDQAKEFNLRDVEIRVIISDSLFFTTSMPVPGRYFIGNHRDSVKYYYNKNSNIAYRESYEPNKSIFFPNMRYPDTVKNISGVQAQKVVIEWTSDSFKSSSFKKIMWYAPDLPHWMLPWNGVPGFPLKKIRFEFDDQLKYITKTVSIEQITLDESDYLPPEGAKVVDKTKKEE